MATPKILTHQIVSASKNMQTVIDLANKVAKYNTPVHITGETGTGKEILANYIHSISREERPFIGVNCASISPNLFESEFFGHEQGAFTGATQSKEGFFEAADTGTIFLDEISELNLTSQAKLLRTIQEGRTRRVGGLKSKEIDVRVISASNLNLEYLIKERKFRDDLYYRLNVFTIELPPLRERIEDIPFLVEVFVKRQSELLEIKHPYVDKDVIKALKEYSWPGNVRELENTIERAMILSNGNIREEHLDIGPRRGDAKIEKINLALLAESAKRLAETKAILETLKEEKGNKSRCAERLGVSYKTLLTKIKEYDLNDKW